MRVSVVHAIEYDPIDRNAMFLHVFMRFPKIKFA